MKTFAQRCASQFPLIDTIGLPASRASATAGSGNPSEKPHRGTGSCEDGVYPSPPVQPSQLFTARTLPLAPTAASSENGTPDLSEMGKFMLSHPEGRKWNLNLTLDLSVSRLIWTCYEGWSISGTTVFPHRRSPQDGCARLVARGRSFQRKHG